MVEIPIDVLNAFGVRPRTEVEIGYVFDLQPPHVYFYGQTYARPAVVARVRRTPAGEPVMVYLFYASTKNVPGRFALRLEPHDGGIREKCSLDVRVYKEITAADLLAACPKLGSLITDRCEELEALIPVSALPERIRALPE